MAETGGTKIGTMIAELDLDRTKYDAALMQAMEKADSVTIDIEKAWKKLGSRSEESINKQRATAVYAYEAIARSGVASAAEIERAEITALAKLEKIRKTYYAAGIAHLTATEQAWKTLGSTSVAEVDKMKADIVSAYQVIKADGTATAADIANANRVAKEQMAAIDRRYFGEVEEHISKTEAAWKTLGSKSESSINSMKSEIKQAYNDIANSGTASAEEIARADRTAKQKMEAIDKRYAAEAIEKIEKVERATKEAGKTASMSGSFFREMFGAFTLANMATDAMYALGRAIKQTFVDGFQAVESFRLNTATLGATIATFADKTGKSMAEVYKTSYDYAERLNYKMEEWNIKTLASGENLRAMVETMAQAGVFIDLNNAKQEKGIIAMANALAAVTQGQEQDKQFRQETRGLLDGEVRFTNRLAVLLDSAVGGALKKNITMWKQEGTLIERMGDLLVGFNAATEDLAGTWRAVSTTIETVYNRVLRGMFVPIYQDIVNMTREVFLNLLDQNSAAAKFGESVGGVLYKAWVDVKNVTKAVMLNIEAWGPVLKPVMSFAGMMMDGFGQILALTVPIGARLAELVKMTWAFAETAARGANIIFMAITGQWGAQLSTAMSDLKASWASVGVYAGKAFSDGVMDEVMASLIEYNKQIKTLYGTDANQPNMGLPGTSKEELEEKEKALEKFYASNMKMMSDEVQRRQESSGIIRGLQQAEMEFIIATTREQNEEKEKAAKAAAKIAEALAAKEQSELQKTYDLNMKLMSDEVQRRQASSGIIRSIKQAEMMYLINLTRQRVSEAEKAAEAEIKAAEKAAKEAKAAYDDLGDTLQANIKNILKDWKSAWESLVDIVKDTLYEIGAELLKTNFVLPIAVSFMQGAGLSWNGVAASAMQGAGGGGGGSILNLGSTLLSSSKYLKAATGYLTSIFGVSSVSTPASVGLMYPGGTTLAGAPSVLGTTGGGAGVSGAASMTPAAWGTAAGYAFIAVAAALTLHKVFGSSQGNPQIGLQSFNPELDTYQSGHDAASGTDWMTSHGSLGDDGNAISASIRDYFQQRFSDLDEAFGVNVSKILGNKDFFQVIIRPGDYESMPEAITALGTKIFSEIRSEVLTSFLRTKDWAGVGYTTEQGVVGREWGEVGEAGDSGTMQMGWKNIMGDVITSTVDALFSDDFFQKIALEGEDGFQTFTRWAHVMNSFDEPVERLTGMMDDFGLSAEQAWMNMEAIIGVLNDLEESVMATHSSSVLDNIRAMNQGWIDLRESMVALHASTEELDRAQTSWLETFGAMITGFSADSITSYLLQDDPAQAIKDYFAGLMNNILAGIFAENLMDSILGPLNARIGALFAGSDTWTEEQWTENTALAASWINEAMDGIDFEGFTARLIKVGEAVDDSATTISTGTDKLDQQSGKGYNKAMHNIVTATDEVVVAFEDYTDRIRAVAKDLESQIYSHTMPSGMYSVWQIQQDYQDRVNEIMETGGDPELLDRALYLRDLQIQSLIDQETASRTATTAAEEISEKIQEASKAASIWATAADKFKSMLTGLLYTSSNPADAEERLMSIKDWLDANPINEGNAEEVAAMWELYLSTAQEAYQRPSAAYQQIYNDSIEALKDLERYSRDREEEALSIQYSQEALLSSIQEEMSWIASNGISSILDALTALNDFIGDGGSGGVPGSVYGMTTEQLSGYNKGMLQDYSRWFANNPEGTMASYAGGTLERGPGQTAYWHYGQNTYEFDRYTPIAEFANLHPNIKAFLMDIYNLTEEDLAKYVFTGYANGTNYVPKDGLYYLHEGEAVKTKKENTEGGGGGLHLYMGDISISGANRQEVTRIVEDELSDFGSRIHKRVMKMRS